MTRFVPLPIFLGDTFGSMVAVMLFPEDLHKARAWHARHLSRGDLRKHLGSGSSFDDRFDAFVAAVGGAEVDKGDVAARLAGATLAADAFKALWLLICEEPETASWSRAIEMVCDTTSRKESGSPSHIRKQLKLFAPVVHLWLGWKLSGQRCPLEKEVFQIGYPILMSARSWAESRPPSFRTVDSYLSVAEYGPWPELARVMEKEGGRALRLSRRQPLQGNL